MLLDLEWETRNLNVLMDFLLGSVLIYTSYRPNPTVSLTAGVCAILFGFALWFGGWGWFFGGEDWATKPNQPPTKPKHSTTQPTFYTRPTYAFQEFEPVQT